MKIVNFEQKHYEELLAFSKKVWPEKSEEYLKYRLYQIPEKDVDNKHNLLVMNDEGKIVGCTLYIPTKARINDKEEKIFWGHDMFVEEKYRGAAGLLLIIEMLKNISGFGFGTTDINYKIQKELGSKFIGAAKQFLIFNIWSFKLLLIKLKLNKIPALKIVIFPDELRIGSYIFTKVSNVGELKIPNNGYWSDSTIDMDLIRDEHFLKNRFFDNFLKYHFYKLEPDNLSQYDECYFVVRPIIQGGFPAISVVDFRFNLKKPEQFKLIFKVVARLGRINRFPIATLRTSVEYGKISFFPFVYRTDSQEHIVTSFPVDTDIKLFVTNADSDTDFLTASYY